MIQTVLCPALQRSSGVPAAKNMVPIKPMVMAILHSFSLRMGVAQK